MLRFSFISFLFLILSQPSMALIELKAGYGILASKPDLAGFYSGSSSDLPSAAPNAGLTIDAVATIPLVGIGAGLRLENMKINYDSSVLGISNQMTRTSVILSYRLIDTLIYLGPILTYGLNHTNDIKISTGGNTISKISSNKVTSYSLGVEAGVKFLLWSVGLEAGTMGMQYKDATDSYNTALVKDLDMSGAYTKLFVGFGF